MPLVPLPRVRRALVVALPLRLQITDNANNWDPTGRTVDVHRLLNDWTEGNGNESNRGTGNGATWNCATDSAIQPEIGSI